MSKTISVDPGAFLTEASKLAKELEPFKSYSNKTSKQFLADIEGFNSDFIEALKKLLRHINDDAGPEILAIIEEHQRKITLLADTFKEADDEVATSISGGS